MIINYINTLFLLVSQLEGESRNGESEEEREVVLTEVEA